jgi:proteasome accessory factor B
MKSPKIQRWIDLLAALLRRRFPITLEEITDEVPAYRQGKGKETLRRMFERDKDELRAYGVPIETVPMPEGDAPGYRLLSRDFYLPYLALRSEGRTSRPRKVDRYGYSALPTLTFEPDELAAVADAGARVRELGNPQLAEEAESALRSWRWTSRSTPAARPMSASRPRAPLLTPRCSRSSVPRSITESR